MSTLNDYQQRYVISILAQVSHHLDNIESLVRGGHADLTDVKQDIDQSEYTGLSASIQELRAEMDSIRGGLQKRATTEEASARWLVITNLEFASVELQELTRSRLAGYGDLDQAVYQKLKVRLDALQDTMMRQLRVLRDPD
ncbi:MAG TPA: hypothetical protein VFX47_04915 [Gammaproteobacteria bacterium]|nr:hypothetical protein [Gammaproteobacteria bacterium]